MISTKKLIRMARNWQRMPAMGRKRIPSLRNCLRIVSDRVSCNELPMAEKGHFVIYTTDHERFVIPLACLNTNIFRELFRMSQEEFGLSSDGPIIVPCDSVFMSYIVLLVRRGLAKDVEKALLSSIYTSCCTSFHQGRTGR